ncbi:dihydrofolate reductase [Capsaspora owczarzaki ATCC 30864]|uniref:dihydrofolate reductase n=1 Tax=Capsaspora owczarzaki (strain ATCC 30864) TaxID=595528 RepID=A0A0D2WQG5_CAPO3|nr:dihydrofolate reductase [Capsaspora owczarzaki ATCC 30864]KJE93138.1 dihydrofolate reductase [Capsaspora owczarzaki ATCC 30864]|eukprot:XP_004347795.2 dihydrofolate reductase [Capsaspora owczarzaki ATCC 30864]
MQFSIVVAATRDALGIGLNNRLPWKLSGDMQYFKRLTLAPNAHSVAPTATAAATTASPAPDQTMASQTSDSRVVLESAVTTTTTTTATPPNAVIMGRSTWTSIPAKFRPLPDRLNVVLTSNPDARSLYEIPEHVLVEPSFSSALQTLEQLHANGTVNQVFVIGGAQVYATALQSPLLQRIYLTQINADIHCDVFMPPIDPAFRIVASEPRTENGIAYEFQVLQRQP